LFFRYLEKGEGRREGRTERRNEGIKGRNKRK
jgi:hypothetical protein